MDWLNIVLGSAVSLSDSLTGTAKAKAEASEAAANAQIAAIKLETDPAKIALQAEKLKAESDHQTIMYALIGLGVIIAGVVAYKAVA